MTLAHAIRPDWIAVDWGTSNLRAFAMTEDGSTLAEASSDKGMSSLKPDEFEPALRALLQDWETPSTCTVIACGMVGSRQGWLEAPYRATPCMAQTDRPIPVQNCGDDLKVWLIPGIKQNDPADVMRGEETQIAGFLSLNPEWDGVICLPGTHSKWVHVSAGEIVSFRTFMTGELFDVISKGTVLRHSLGGTDMDQKAFDEAASETLSRPEKFSANLFSLRAADLLKGQSPAIARAKLSGALIGMELAAAKSYWLGQRVAVIGTNDLSDLYERALNQQSVTVERYDTAAVTRAGLCTAYAAI
ncbi:2-dehydro-3-deoxygalactonokinase [Planktotalea sp.]|uniref:2-dehydro-3-deoxygalactonokinase n=1 Tax=Planktotalea sp. TaxID=2029877 RepID=UPI0025D4D6CF|nr:2-dehydro-3-deoxygalactonokinase [Planktotalea sp.]